MATAKMNFTDQDHFAWTRLKTLSWQLTWFWRWVYSSSWNVSHHQLQQSFSELMVEKIKLKKKKNKQIRVDYWYPYLDNESMWSIGTQWFKPFPVSFNSLMDTIIKLKKMSQHSKGKHLADSKKFNFCFCHKSHTKPF